MRTPKVIGFRLRDSVDGAIVGIEFVFDENTLPSLNNVLKSYCANISKSSYPKINFAPYLNILKL